MLFSIKMAENSNEKPPFENFVWNKISRKPRRGEYQDDTNKNSSEKILPFTSL